MKIIITLLVFVISLACYGQQPSSGYVLMNADGTVRLPDGSVTNAMLATTPQAALVSGTNIKTINGSSILGSGDLVVSAEGGLVAANNLSDLTNTATARTNLGVTTQAATLLAAWPVGSIYISVSSTNPSSLFGGTWVAFGAGRVMVGLDAGQTEFDVVEETGGAKTHTLTEAEMPSHTHVQNPHNHSQRYNAATTGPLSGLATAPDASSNNTTNYVQTTADATAVNQSTGGGGAHNNLQPYIVVYMFKRTL